METPPTCVSLTWKPGAISIRPWEAYWSQNSKRPSSARAGGGKGGLILRGHSRRLVHWFRTDSPAPAHRRCRRLQSVVRFELAVPTATGSRRRSGVRMPLAPANRDRAARSRACPGRPLRWCSSSRLEWWRPASAPGGSGNWHVPPHKSRSIDPRTWPPPRIRGPCRRKPTMLWLKLAPPRETLSESEAVSGFCAPPLARPFMKLLNNTIPASVTGMRCAASTLVCERSSVRCSCDGHSLFDWYRRHVYWFGRRIHRRPGCGGAGLSSCRTGAG